MSHDTRADELAVLRTVTNSMAVAVTHCDHNFVYRWVSARYAEWIGRPPTEIVGRNIADVLGPAAFEKLRPHFEQVLAGHSVQYEELVEFQGIGPRWISATYTPTWNSASECDGWVAVVLDVDDRKRLEQARVQYEAALREADRHKDEFLATLAHELRNPLAPIRNATEIIKRLGLPAAELQWANDVIDRQARQLTRLVDDLLDMARITRGHIELRLALVELRPVLDNALEASRILIEEAGHRLHVEIPAEPIHIHADPARFAQILQNLLNNAARYTPTGGVIHLTCTTGDSEVLIRVRDNGSGIRPEMLARIFEPFAQDHRVHGAHRGLGIGLTLVRQLVELHGWHVQARSDGPDTGSEFILRLPRQPAATKAPGDPDRDQVVQ